VHDWDDTTSVADPASIKPPEASTRDKAYLIVLAGSNVGAMFKIEQDEITLGRAGGATIRLMDEGVSRIHCRIRLLDGMMFVEDMESRNGTFCNGEKIRSQPLQDGDKIQLGRTTILKFTYHDRLDETFQQQMLDSALRDGLTGAYNQRYFLDRMESELRFAVRHRTPLSLLLLDLDHFKAINDTHGHIVGDRMLKAFADTIHRNIRNEDVFARYGGEEFAIMTRAISRADVLRFAERLRLATANISVMCDGKKVTVTCSIGVSTSPEDGAQTPMEFVKCADAALYKAKSSGRNRVQESDLENAMDDGTSPGR
jgi:two-component system cell cycle response regulator